MSDQLAASATGLDRLTLRLEGATDQVRRCLVAAMTIETIRLQGIVMMEKLTGGVLKARSGNLRGSINQRVDESDTAVTGIVGANMATAGYARFWEYGFSGIEQVRGHYRTVRANENLFKKKRQMYAMSQYVRPFARKVEQPSRSYLRSTLAEEGKEILAALREAVSEGMA